MSEFYNLLGDPFHESDSGLFASFMERIMATA